MTSDIGRRVAALEAQAPARKLILFSWRLDDSLPVAGACGDRRFAQAQGESRAEFYDRMAGELPQGAVVWVDQQKERA